RAAPALPLTGPPFTIGADPRGASMNLQRTGVTVVATLALTACLALPARAQPPGKPAADNEPAVKRMVIENGPMRTVHYFSSTGFSPGEESALRDLERAENGLAVA